MALKTYDFKNWIVQVAGVEIGGFADDEGFSIDWSEDWWTNTNGVDGDTTRNFKNNYTAEITLKLKQTSDSNAWLSLLFLADSNLTPKTNASTVPVTITSLVGVGGTFICDQCWIKKPPTVSGGGEASEYEWVLVCPNLPPLIS